MSKRAKFSEKLYDGNYLMCAYKKRPYQLVAAARVVQSMRLVGGNEKL
jgi:hypothetical protein